MSHYMINSGYFFTKFIFIGLEDNQIELVKGLKSELHDITQKRYWVFMKHPQELSYHIDSRSLVIDINAENRQVTEITARLGFPFCISWIFFLKNFYQLVTLQNYSQKNKICLAFLVPDYSRIIQTIHQLYGYEIIETTDYKELPGILESGISYLVFDLDMNGTSKKDRYLVMQKIQSHCKDGMQTSVLKNFDTGSLFNDIISPVKEISNLILSPDEYLLFIRKFFYIKNLENIYKETANEPELAESLSGNDIFIKRNRKGFNIFSELKDSKSIYHKVQKMKDSVFSRIRSDMYESAFLRYMLTAETAKVIHNNCQESQRELFTFFSSPPESVPPASGTPQK